MYVISTILQYLVRLVCYSLVNLLQSGAQFYAYFASQLEGLCDAFPSDAFSFHLYFWFVIFSDACLYYACFASQTSGLWVLFPRLSYVCTLIRGLQYSAIIFRGVIVTYAMKFWLLRTCCCFSCFVTHSLQGLYRFTSSHGSQNSMIHF